MKNIIHVVFLGVVFSGCNGPYDHFDIDYKYTNPELEIVKLSFNEWRAATNSESADISYTDNMIIGDGVFGSEDIFRDFGAATIQKVSINDPGYQPMIDYMQRTGINGAGIEGKLIITITESFYNKDGEFKSDFFHAVILHELGHFFGLMHGNGLIMNPSANVPCIDREALDVFCEIHEDCINPIAMCE